MSMSQSLEVRTPFLDHKLVEYVFSLPSKYKIDHYNRKKILKDAFKDELPASYLPVESTVLKFHLIVGLEEN